MLARQFAWIVDVSPTGSVQHGAPTHESDDTQNESSNALAPAQLQWPCGHSAPTGTGTCHSVGDTVDHVRHTLLVSGDGDDRRRADARRLAQRPAWGLPGRDAPFRSVVEASSTSYWYATWTTWLLSSPPKRYLGRGCHDNANNARSHCQTTAASLLPRYGMILRRDNPMRDISAQLYRVPRGPSGLSYISGRWLLICGMNWCGRAIRVI